MKINWNWIVVLALIISSCGQNSTTDELTVAEEISTVETGDFLIQVDDLEETRDFYTWTSDRIPVVSAHRGGPYPGFPENAIETFDNVIKFTPAIIELDVAMTKDGVLVLMHDDDLERTTTGKGKVEEVTYEYIQTLFLEDEKGAQTEFRVPTFKDALIWSKGKVLLTVDVKQSVPYEKLIAEIRETGSEAHAAVITYSFAAAKKMHSLAPELMLSITIRNEEEIQRFEETGIPWTRVIAFTGVAERPQEFNQALHEKGVFTILGVLGNLDRSAIARGDEIYAGFVQKGADILATDRPIEAAAAIKTLAPSSSSKNDYFTRK
ncbi:MAG: glycerophosphodiester phosphodiesterase family protein [Algoriphagus sp.]|uniref:glycerophosphodiester phosphodiesterase family protein n=1 Tax=Algoriphagus sp. TaxID=1872435 RepID=UPI0026022631|nr:glycerophosphodiester phosphodiesterase family protein [Algoriphagus sp.]MDG1275814.1 glycerophosphodiester phosphodiesterase family protein [Algoriphagus sp.]